MSGAIPPLLQYAFTAWCSVKAQGQLYFYLLANHSNKFALRFMLEWLKEGFKLYGLSLFHMVWYSYKCFKHTYNYYRGFKLNRRQEWNVFQTGICFVNAFLFVFV
jgi:hypothetical protein